MLSSLVVATVAGVALFEPIPQDPAYHDFADRRSIAGIPNALDVLSNLPFLLVGLYGLRQSLRHDLRFDRALRPAMVVFFLGVALTAVGSGLYHLTPDNATLVWDRVPMTLVFMSLVAVVVGELVSLRLGRFLLWPLVGIGIGSVAWWAWTEQTGQGDLRPYVLVQFLPMLLLPLVLILYRSRWTHVGYFWMVGGWYVLAKLFEYLDQPIFDRIAISGHTLKHLAAAAGVGCLLRMLHIRAKAERKPIAAWES